MRRTKVWQRILSLIVSLGMLMQGMAPLMVVTVAAATPNASPAQMVETAAAAPTADLTQPTARVQPLSVSRTQSTFTDLGGSTVITYTLQNHLAPRHLPDVPANATPQQIVDALADLDLPADPHTLRNVILVAEVTADSSILAASHPSDVDGDTYVFQLADLPPQATATIVVTAALPADVSATTFLVNASGWASLDGQAVTAEAAPALALPSGLDPWLISTIDANTADVEMLQTLARIGGDPTAIFAFVRGLGFEAYRGSLRGTRGTLWSGAGNSLDQSSLLIAMLRAGGVPARYRHGALDQASARTLIAGMFPAATTLLGHVAPEIPSSDPINDPALITEVQDHWWVEAYLNGAWTDLDPSFADAAVGQLFAGQIAGDGTDRIAELTDDLRPKVTIKLQVETYNQLNVGGLAAVATHLEHTFRVVEIATASVVFANQVTTDVQGGAVFANTMHTFVPFLHINDNDEIILGDAYQEALTNFPLATTLVTGAWLLFEIEDIDGGVTSYQRILRDRLGYDIRTYGGTPDIAVDDTSVGIFSEFDVYSLSFFPGVVPTTALGARRAALTGVVSELSSDAGRLQELAAVAPLDAEQQTEVNQIRARYQLNLSLFLNGVSMSFAEAADRASRTAQEAFLVKAYHDDPRLVIVSHEVVGNAAQFNVDLRTTLERTLAYPGQAIPATFGFNLFKGINESWLEGEVLGTAAEGDVLTTARVMQAAHEQGIEFIFITEGNLSALTTIGMSAEAQARITAAILAGNVVNIPSAPPLVNGEPTIGWWEIDPSTGETIGVMENGLHNALIEFVGTLLFGTTVGRLTDFVIGATAATWDFLGKQVFKATGSGDFGTPAKDALGNLDRGLSCLTLSAPGCAGVGKGYLDYGYAAMAALLDYLDSNDPPLPDILLGSTIFTPTQTSDSAVLNVSANLGGGAITANVQTDFLQMTDAGGGLSFYAAALDPLASGAAGDASAFNHVSSASLTPAGADLHIAAPNGSITVGGQPVAPGDGVAIAAFAGTLAVTATTPDTDQIVLNGNGDLFALRTSPQSSAITPVQAAVFDVVLTSTFADAFTIIVSAPDGWDVTVNDAGQVTATPPAGAAPNAYSLVITAQSAAFPRLTLTAAHTVTVTPYAGWSLEFLPDPLITVPMGTKLNHGDAVNTGQAQVPDAAYLIELNNTANVPHTYDVTVSGLPAGWVLLGGESRTAITVSLPPGAVGQIGLYVAPDHLPPAATTYGISVLVVDQNGLSAGANQTFTMPAVPFSYVTAAPVTRAVTTTSATTYDITISNVGNAAGEFGLTVKAANFDGSVSIGALPVPVTIPAGAGSTFPVAVSTSGAQTRSSVPLFFGSPVAGTVYTPAAIAELLVVSAAAEPFVNAADRCSLPPTLNAAILSLATAVDELSLWCQQGSCPLPLRDRVVAAGEALAEYAGSEARPYDLPALAGVEAAVSDLAGQTAGAAILAAIADLGAAVTALSSDLCEVEQHRASVRFTPYVEAILLGEAADFSLDVTNQGTLGTTYGITVTGLPGSSLLFNETIASGATVSLPIATTPAALGIYTLAADVVAEIPGGAVDVRRSAVARLNVVDRFVQVTQVIAAPPFVETGLSSTTLSVEVANLSGVAQEANATTAVLAPDGAIAFSATAPLTVLAGNPRVYELTDVDTSGWAAGIYTITVDLLDAGSDLIPDGSGYSYLSVGQALQLSQTVYPEVVAPGTVTVTTLITSEINGDGLAAIEAQGSEDGHLGMTIYAAPLIAADHGYLARAAETEMGAPGGVQPSALGEGTATALAAADEEVANRPISGGLTLPLTPFHAADEDAASFIASDPLPAVSLSPTYVAPPVFTRLEQNDPAFIITGAWTNVNLGRASGGSHLRSNTAGNSAELGFTGTWVNLGFIGDRWGGYAEISIDGSSWGTIDLYRSEETPISFHYKGLGAGPHTVTVEVAGSGNPFATLFRVQLDYVEYGDGSALPDGDFEQNDPRVIRSSGWTTGTYAGASGGSYSYGSTATAWFPFSGDSFSLQTLAYSSGGKARLFVDGVYLDTIDMFAPVFASSGITRTFSYEGLGSGPHVLQIMTYQNQTAIDKLTTPGQAPFIDPDPPVSGITRFEADHSTILYNGVPFTQTAQSWVRVANINANRASAGEYINSATADDTISFSFEGAWLGIGFAVDRYGGQAEIAIDGDLVETVDLYSRYEDTAGFYFGDLGAGPHSVTITVLGTSHPNAIGSRVYLDFFDVWDGQPLPDGTFEEDAGHYPSDRLFYSNGWSRTLNADAGGGAYGSSTSNVTVWFPFTGNSVTYQGWTSLSYDQVEIRVDGVSQGKFDIYSYDGGPRTYAFDNLGSGPHVLELRQYRGVVTLDAFITPATEPGYQPPAPSTIFRYEEDHPDFRYNGYPFATTPTSWVLLGGGSPWRSSGANNMTTSTAGDVWSLDFEGRWLNVGFRSTAGSGIVDILIDEVSQGQFDTSGGVNEVKNFTFGDLSPGAHSVEVVVVSGTVLPDYMDVWDGGPLSEGWHDAQLEDDSGRLHFSNKGWWRRAESIYAYNGDYLQGFASTSNNIWFTFIGTDLTVLGHNRADTTLHVVIDGVPQGVFDMTPQFSQQPFALHFADLGEGPHVAQVFLPSLGANTSRIDAFEVNPDGLYSHTPVVEWYDFTPQESLTGTTGTGFASTIAIGDLNGDGVVELVASGLNGRLYVYRGDGADTGDGTPILWTSDLVGPAAEPALADLTGDGYAEIVVTGRHGTFAFTHDGTLLWDNPAVVSYYPNEDFGWGGPTIGNFDLDPEPEIVIAASDDALYVLDHQGDILFSDPIGRWPTVPVAADITGDGVLDVIVAQGWTLTVYDIFNNGQIVWSRTLPDPINVLGGAGVFGSPAVADLTGDGQPEIIINWGHIVEALRADGTVLWRYLTNSTSLYRPSPITVADVTGDGEVNIVTASALRSGFLIFNHLLMVLDAAGNLVWEQEVADSTASASGVAAQDLTGNGVWEILWNGATDGFLVIRGSDGKRLFNEPVTGSGTVLDYPTLGDVDGDGSAEVVVSGRQGLFIIGHQGRWVDSRPNWNQHNYHVTNINDDWSVPVNEPNSWDLHNTYRTQTPDRTPAPSYQMVFTYTAGGPNVSVLTETASITLTAAPPLYGWAYRQKWYQPIITTTFDSLLTGMQPGETRQVSAGTEVAYRLPSGFNTLTLPPLYVTAQGLGELSPAAQSVVVGGTAVYTLTLTNSGSSAATYTLELGGLPAAWLDYPTGVPVGAGETVEVAITVTIPPDADSETLALWLDVDNGSGGAESFVAELTLFDGLALALDPVAQTGVTGQALTTTLTVSNLEAAPRTYSLTASGMAEVTLPDTVTVAGHGAEQVAVAVVPTSHGPQPFTIMASAPSGAERSVDGVAEGEGRFGVLLSLMPGSAAAGPGAIAGYTLTLTNVGDTPDSYALSVDAPAGWTAELQQFGAPVTEITVPPLVFNSVELLLLVTPDAGALPGSYPVVVQAVSQSRAGVVGTAVATAEVGGRGVTVALSPASRTVDPRTPTSWDVIVTNVGSQADTFDLAVSGAPAPAGALSASSVSLAPGAAQTVQLTAALRFLVPGSRRFAVAARSQADSRIAAQAEAIFTVAGFEGVAVIWEPADRTVEEALETSLTLVISNTGNALTTYQLSLAGVGLTATPAIGGLVLPPGSAGMVRVRVAAGAAGSYQLEATATSAGGSSGSATANVTFTPQVGENQAPVVDAGPDQLVGVGEVVQFAGSATDPDGDALVSFEWDFGDGGSAAGTQAPSHTYTAPGSYTVTLKVTDARGGVGSDTLTVAVTESGGLDKRLYLPLVNRSP